MPSSTRLDSRADDGWCRRGSGNGSGLFVAPHLEQLFMNKAHPVRVHLVEERELANLYLCNRRILSCVTRLLSRVSYLYSRSCCRC
jgi:hypothetical protein